MCVCELETSLTVRVRIALRCDNALSVECLRLDSGAAMGGKGGQVLFDCVDDASFGFGTWPVFCLIY